MIGRKPKQKQPEPGRRQPGVVGGSVSVFSYRASRTRSEAPLNRHEDRTVAKTSNHSWLINLPTYVALGVIVGLTFYALTLSAQPRVQVFNNGSIQLRDTQTYAQAASDIQGSSVLNYLKPTIDTAHIAKQLQSQFPELSDVSVNVPLIDRRPVVQVALTTPKLLLVSGQDTFVIGETGRILVKTSDLPSGTSVDVPVITDQANLKLSQGQLALPAKDVKFIAVVIEELKARGFTIQNLMLPPRPQELDVRLTGQNYYLKFNFLENARQQAGSYLAVKQKFDADNITPGEYVDLRVTEHVYYK